METNLDILYFHFAFDRLLYLQLFRQTWQLKKAGEAQMEPLLKVDISQAAQDSGVWEPHLLAFLDARGSPEGGGSHMFLEAVHTFQIMGLVAFSALLGLVFQSHCWRK